MINLWFKSRKTMNSLLHTHSFGPSYREWWQDRAGAAEGCRRSPASRPSSPPTAAGRRSRRGSRRAPAGIDFFFVSVCRSWTTKHRMTGATDKHRVRRRSVHAPGVTGWERVCVGGWSTAPRKTQERKKMCDRLRRKNESQRSLWHQLALTSCEFHSLYMWMD